MMSGDQQHDALAGGDRLFKAAIDRPPGSVEIHPVQIEHAVRLDVACAKPAIPGPVQGRSEPRSRGSTDR